MTPAGAEFQERRHAEEESTPEERAAISFRSTGFREHVAEIMDEDHTRFQITHDSLMVPSGAFTTSLGKQYVSPEICGRSNRSKA